MIRDKAKEATGLENFKANESWLQLFLKRKNLNKTTVCQEMLFQSSQISKYAYLCQG